MLRLFKASHLRNNLFRFVFPARVKLNAFISCSKILLFFSHTAKTIFCFFVSFLIKKHVLGRENRVKIERGNK